MLQGQDYYADGGGKDSREQEPEHDRRQEELDGGADSTPRADRVTKPAWHHRPTNDR